MSIQTPFVTPFVSIRDFGAVPNDPSPAIRLANSESFKHAQAAMQSNPFAWGHPIFVPSGTFYLADDLHISKSLELFGTGAQGESILMFPAIFKITNEALGCLTSAGVPNETIAKLQSLLDKEFLDAEELMKPIGELLGDDAAGAHRAKILKCAFFRGTSLIIDPGSEVDPALDGANCVIRDLQVISEENWTTTELDPFNPDNFDPPTFEGTSKGTPGIKMNRPAIIQSCYINGFTGTGIYIIAGGGVFNANQWRIHDVYIARCGGHGIHVDGGETQGGLCTGAKIIVVGGSGIYESSAGGNTYVGCYVEVIKGRGYVSDSGGQTTFVGCFSEANERVRLSAGGNVWVGGSGAGFTDDTTAFIAEGYGNVHPFEVPNLKEFRIRLLVGFPNDGSDPTTLYAWVNNNGDIGVMRWDMDNKIWSTEDQTRLPEVDPVTNKFKNLPELSFRRIATYLTGSGHPRGPWLQGFGEILLGQANGPIKISRGDQPADGTGEPGDIVYNTNPQVGDYIGRVCIGLTREWKPFGKIDPVIFPLST